MHSHGVRVPVRLGTLLFLPFLSLVVSGRAVAQTPQDLPMTAEEVALYVGTYSGPMGDDVLDVMVFEQNGQLVAQPGPTSQPSRLMSQGNHVFVPEDDQGIRVTFVMEAGRPVGIRVEHPGGIFEGRRGATPVAGEPHPTAALAGAALDLPLTAADIARYVGTYTGPLGGRMMWFRVFEENGQLIGQPGNSPPSRLLSQGEHLFRPQADPEIRVTFTEESGRAVALRMEWDGQVFEGRRQ